jgi:hypothetical protein
MRSCRSDRSTALDVDGAIMIFASAIVWFLLALIAGFLAFAKFGSPIAAMGELCLAGFSLLLCTDLYARRRSGFTKHRRLRPAPAAEGVVANSPGNPPIPLRDSLLALDPGCSPSPAGHL